ncbi:MAG: DUF4493 domain-containing protein [Rikenellaceae bacterium]
MKKSFKYIYIAVAGVLLLASACQNSDVDGVMGADEGALSIQYSFAQTRSSVSSAIEENSTLKIYNSDGELLRRYAPISETPSDIYLVAGSYSVVVEAGDECDATLSTDELKYYGSADFTITKQETSSVLIDCSMENVAANVSFDSTIAKNFDEEFYLYFAASDSFPDIADLESTPSLRFEADGEGYFYLPDDVSNISWWFYGKSSDSDIANGGELSTKGVISDVKAATRYSLSLKYSPSADGFLAFLITVDESEVEKDVVVSFSPKPVIAGVDFSIVDTYNYTSSSSDELQFKVTASNDLKSISVDAGLNSSTIYSLTEDDSWASAVDSPVSYSLTSETEGVITMKTSLFSGSDWGYGGERNVKIFVADYGNVSTTLSWAVRTSGFNSEPENVNLWLNSADFNFTLTEYPNNDSVKFRLKNSDGSWGDELACSSVGDYGYSANVSAEWKEVEYSGPLSNGYGGSVLTGGIFAGNDYSYGVFVDGASEPIVEGSYQTAAGHTITDSDMSDDDLYCFSTSNSSSDKSWDSGNNTFTGSLCKQSSIDGNSCALLTSTTSGIASATYLATGNMFMGTFNFSSLTGYVSFGQPFTWESRPRTFKFRYKATIGNIDYTNTQPSTVHLSKGDKDNGVVRLIIVDWSSRHQVASGMSSASGVWNPETSKSVSSGAIIGYATYIIDESNSSMEEVELDIIYYDTVTKPSSSYTMVVQASNSFYGDYMFGCSSNVMYIDDFELGY